MTPGAADRHPRRAARRRADILGRLARIYPALERLYLTRWPRTVTGHLPGLQDACDRVRVLGDIGVFEQVKMRLHGVSVFVPEQRPDVSREAELVIGTSWCHLDLPCGRCVRGRSNVAELCPGGQRLTRFEPASSFRGAEALTTRFGELACRGQNRGSEVADTSLNDCVVRA